MTYSDYRGQNTVIVLFGVTPTYPGPISDTCNSMTEKSEILHKLQPGDYIMADKGFTISNNLLQLRGLSLTVPPFRFGNSPFTAKEVETTKVVANLRTVVENCILRARYYRIL